LTSSECDLHWADVRDTNHAAFAKYFQQLYLQVRAQEEKGEKRESAKVHMR
jgi:hypothetical protein